MSDGTIGFGTLLKVGDGGGPETFTAIAEIADISGPGLSHEPVQATHMQSPGAWHEYIKGLKDGGEISLDLTYLPGHATQDASTGLLKDFNDRILRNFQLVFPDTGTTTWSFAAFITGFEPSAPKDDRLSAAVTLKISGQPTLA